MKVPRRKLYSSVCRRTISTTPCRHQLRDLSELPDCNLPSFHEAQNNDLLSLRWPSPPRNILLVQKNHAYDATSALMEFANHIHTTYPSISIILEPTVASVLHPHLPFPIYTPTAVDTSHPLSQKVDLTTTFGGDGTILHASSLFASTPIVPPILSFSMGTLGFLGEWKFQEHKRAFREVYMSGADLHPTLSSTNTTHQDISPGWSPSTRGRILGATRTARVLLRNRLKVSLSNTSPTSTSPHPSQLPPTHALNEVVLHRGSTPHLTHISISVSNRFLTEAVADGLIISTPTGSTAYSLSSGGSIIHPLVSSLLLTPICPRSLSFRPLVLPGNAEITLRLSERNRGPEVDVSVDGVKRDDGLGMGGEVKVWGEEIERSDGRAGWRGGVPCIMRGEGGGDEGWVGGLNGLLKFNYPFGEEG